MAERKIIVLFLQYLTFILLESGKANNQKKDYYPFLAFTSAAWALARFNMAAFSSEVKSLRGVGPGTKFPEGFLEGAGLAS